MVDDDGYVSVIHFTPREGARKAAICRSSLESAADGGLCAIDNSVDNVHGRLRTAEILFRARSQVKITCAAAVSLNLQIGNTKYHLLEHNCEVFATWCRNDFFCSKQVWVSAMSPHSQHVRFDLGG